MRSPTQDGRRVRSDRARAVLLRDAALERIGRTRRWIIVGSLALTGALAALTSALLPGKSFAKPKAASTSGSESTPSPARVRSTASTAPALPAPAGASQLGLAGPAQGPSPSPVQSSPPPASTPAPAPSGGAVVSGGS